MGKVSLKDYILYIYSKNFQKQVDIVVRQIKPLLGNPTSHIRMLVFFPSYSFSNFASFNAIVGGIR